jgi:hypothetical protein
MRRRRLAVFTQKSFFRPETGQIKIDAPVKSAGEICYKNPAP